MDGSAARAAGCAGAEAISPSTPGRMLAKLEATPVEVQAYGLDDEALAEAAASLQSKPLALQAGDSLPSNSGQVW